MALSSVAVANTYTHIYISDIVGRGLLECVFVSQYSGVNTAHSLETVSAHVRIHTCVALCPLPSGCYAASVLL